jgi:hypothetical protein
MILLYKGARGRGKTLTMLKDALVYYNNGWQVYRNMQNTIIGEYISNEDLLKIDKNTQMQQVVLVIDEIQTLFDSRRSMKKSNLDFSYFLQQIRKRGIILLCTTQYSNTIDLRLRQHIDILALPRHNKQYNVCSVKYIDLTSIEDQEYGITQPDSVKVSYDAKPIYKIYDTEEMIT